MCGPCHVQERCAFRSQGVIAHLIEGYHPDTTLHRVAVAVPISLADGRRATVTEASFRGDLDYPGLLIAHQLQLRSANLGGIESAPPSAPRFPPLATTLDLLSCMHRTLERGSFEVLAQVCYVGVGRVLMHSQGWSVTTKTAHRSLERPVFLSLSFAL